MSTRAAAALAGQPRIEPGAYVATRSAGTSGGSQIDVGERVAARAVDAVQVVDRDDDPLARRARSLARMSAQRNASAAAKRRSSGDEARSCVVESSFSKMSVSPRRASEPAPVQSRAVAAVVGEVGERRGSRFRSAK